MKIVESICEIIMCQVQKKYHVLRCVKNYVCERIGVFDSRDEADKFRAEQEKKIQNDNVFVCVYPLSNFLDTDKL